MVRKASSLGALRYLRSVSLHPWRRNRSLTLDDLAAAKQPPNSPKVAAPPDHAMLFHELQHALSRKKQEASGHVAENQKTCAHNRLQRPPSLMLCSSAAPLLQASQTAKNNQQLHVKAGAEASTSRCSHQTRHQNRELCSPAGSCRGPTGNLAAAFRSDISQMSVPCCDLQPGGWNPGHSPAAHSARLLGASFWGLAATLARALAGDTEDLTASALDWLGLGIKAQRVRRRSFRLARPVGPVGLFGLSFGCRASSGFKASRCKVPPLLGARRLAHGGIYTQLHIKKKYTGTCDGSVAENPEAESLHERCRMGPGTHMAV